MTGPSGASYRADIQRPDGDGWTTVGTHDHAWGETPEEAGWSVLQHHWPVSVYDKDTGGPRRRRAGLRGTAGYRMVLTPASHNRAGPTEPVTFTFADLALAVVRRHAAERRAARERLDAARKAVKEAQWRARVASYALDRVKGEAALLDVPDADITRAARTPRRTKQPKGDTP